MDASTSRPYEGLKVLDLSQAIAGPYCAEILLQNGAEVIKVEPPGGDWGRTIGYGPDGMSAIAIAFNLGKRSICIDAASGAGRALMRRLAAQADVVIESFRPGVMERLGLSYAELARERPELIYVSVTAFGPDGPYADRPGSDSTLQALSGMMVANRDGNGKPRKVGILLVDVATGIYAAQATGGALYRRATQGKGSHVQISLLDGAAAVQSNGIVDLALGAGRPAQALSVPAGTFATADGYINVTSLHDRMFAGLSRAIGKEEWLTDPRYATVAARFEQAAQINAELDAVFQTRPSAHWLEVLGEHSVVCGRVDGYAELLADPHVRDRNIFQEIEQQGIPLVSVPRVPGTQPGLALRPAPRVGEHTREVLAGLGIGTAEIDALFDAGVVASAAHQPQAAHANS